MIQGGDEVLTEGEAKELGASMGLLPGELEAIEKALERVPTRTELTVFAGMWSEHCSYKSTLHLLKHLPKDSPKVLAGPGSHAGVVDVGEGWGVAFKMESHNHPSAVEPYQGAATGVGGILRDIIAQGARPCAVMDSLCFGMPDQPNTKHLVDGVVSGIAGYGNAFGVPNVGGRVVYDPRYHGNPLVNALAAGLVKTDEMRTANARGIGNAVIYVGAATGRDGILGAAFASEELSDDTVEDRPHVQVGDPFAGKKLMEACLSFTTDMGLVSCQDMGASGITCGAMEMAAAGGVGIDIDLETIPLREEGLSPQEIMLSESQERFLFVVEADRADEAVTHFERYGVHAVICGHVVEGDRVRAQYKGQTVVDLPAALVADGTPPANWPVADKGHVPVPYPAFDAPSDFGDTLKKLLSDPNIASKLEITTRYDQTVGNRSVRTPNSPRPGEAAVMKLPGSNKGFALTIQSRGDWCAADPSTGIQALLGATCRDLACAGATLVAITDGLNMASPRDPVENRKLADTISGLGDGLKTLGIPVTGGNVSLYNESPDGPIPPSPMVGALGTVEDVSQLPGADLQDGDVLFLLGSPAASPVTSRYGVLRTGELSAGTPHLDLAADAALSRVLVSQSPKIRSAKDGAMGGLGVALAKMCLWGDVGAKVHIPSDPERTDWWLFGEYAGTAWVATSPKEADAFQTAVEAEGFPVARVGQSGGSRLEIRDHKERVLIDEALTALSESFGEAA